TAAVDQCRPLLGERRDRVRVEVPAGISIEADRRRFEQVLAILLTRAARASGPDGAIDVTAARTGRDIEVRVRDGGTATAAIPLPDLFDPFAAPPEGAELLQGAFGMSLGLALARGLVELQGGQVAVTSGGEGTQLSVRFAILADRAAPPRKVVPPRGQF